MHISHFLMSVLIIPVGVRRATKAEANTRDVELTLHRALVGIVRDGMTLQAEEVWPWEYAILFFVTIVLCGQGDER